MKVGNYNYNLGELVYKTPRSIKDDLDPTIQKLIQQGYSPGGWEYLEFITKESADWFISHRLTYNPKRQDTIKLKLMEQIFALNGITEFKTVKNEFESELV